MSWVIIVGKALPYAFKLILLVEKMFRDTPKSGVQKKELVETMVETAVMGTTEVSTGGQKETWAKLKEPLGEFIDLTCKFLF